MQVKDVMSKDLVWCTHDTGLRDVAALMARRNCGAIPVFENNTNQKLVGIITDRDIVCRTLADGKDPFGMAAGDCMSTPVATIRPDASLEDCARLMEKDEIRRVAVTDANGRCVGIVAQADIARHAPEQETGEVVRKVSQPTAREQLAAR